MNVVVCGGLVVVVVVVVDVTSVVFVVFVAFNASTIAAWCQYHLHAWALVHA